MTEINELEKGETVKVEYESAHSNDEQEISGEVLEAGETWNSEQWEVEFKNGDGVYRVRMDKGGKGGVLDRLQYQWQSGERVRVENTQRVSDLNGSVLSVGDNE